MQGTARLLQTLKEIGLTAKEANVYTTLHMIGSNPASIIAKKCALNRSGCYSILNCLIRKGFVQQTMKKNINYYNAADPSLILRRLQNKKGRIEENIENLSTLVKQFESLKEEYGGRPNVFFFEGSESIKNIMEDTLTSTGIIRAYASLDELTDLLPGYWPGYYKRRTERNIFVKAIYPANKLSYLHKKRDTAECRESRLIPPEFNFHLDILIYENKVAITSLKEKFGLLIESAEMALAHKQIFDLVWQGTNKYDIIMTNLMREQYSHIKSPL